jgi:hypothetical protein
MDDNIRHARLTKSSELSSIGLQRGAVARLQDARGMRLRVETGTVWITHERRRDDVMVQAGETYCIEHDGTTVVSALGRRFALVSIEPPRPVPPSPTFLERLDRFWCSLYVETMPAARSYL